MKVTALAGGVGGAKLLVGLQKVLGADLTAVVNTADDAELFGVHVSPDVDIVTYWLSGIADRERGWGIEGDSFAWLEMRKRMGLESWFSLGDRDLAVCHFRTERMRAGAKLSEVTAEICERLGVVPTVLPMTDDQVATRIVADDGRTLEFQEYFVKERCEPDVREVRIAGIGTATPAAGVLESIERSDRVILCPSNPLLSIGPILAVPGVRDTLRQHPDVIAVTPLIRGAAVKGPLARILTSMGHSADAAAVALMYEDLLGTFVVDESDPEEVAKVEAAGMSVRALDTLMPDLDASERLAHVLLA